MRTMGANMFRVFTRAASIAAIVVAFAGAEAQAQPLTKRAVNGLTVRATALTARSSSGFAVEKNFFVTYGGDVEVTFNVKSDGAHQADVKVYFDGRETCTVSTSSATDAVGLGCGARVSAGGTVNVVLTPNGAPATICCARLKFDLADV